MGVRRQYSREFKLEAVRMADDGGLSLSEVARDLGLDLRMLRRWRKSLMEEGPTAFPGSGNLSPEENEVRRLQRELNRVREERDILKKAVAIFSGHRR